MVFGKIQFWYFQQVNFNFIALRTQPATFIPTNIQNRNSSEIFFGIKYFNTSQLYWKVNFTKQERQE